MGYSIRNHCKPDIQFTWHIGHTVWLELVHRWYMGDKTHSLHDG
nr:unnamed protein product [Callosobruchus chinensis]